MAQPGWPQTDLSSLRMITTGSSIVPLSLIDAWHRRGIPVGQVYGSTETGPTAIYLRAEDAMRKAGSAGLAAMHCEVDLVDAQGEPVAPGAIGEIRVRGPSVMRCYFGQPEATAAAMQDGWYRTGDLARQDEDGFFWVVGRSKDMIISGGENIYPAELEAVLADCPAIIESTVVGVADERWGEVPVAVVIRRSVGCHRRSGCGRALRRPAGALQAAQADRIRRGTAEDGARQGAEEHAGAATGCAPFMTGR